MKKILNLCMAVLFGILLLTACKDDETTGFTLYGFNPNPAVRGERITFYGEGLTAVNAVVFAGGAQTTEITREGSSISVVIPMTAQPGVIELRLSGGVYVTRSALTIDEPLDSGAELLTYTDFSAKTNGVTTVGRKVYIATKNQTDYLSDIVRAEFEGEAAAVEYDADAIVAAGGETAATDAELEALSQKVAFVRGAHLVIVTVPEGARSGAVNLYNSSDDRFEAPAVEIAQSAAQSIAPATGVIPGVTRLTVTGENFGLVTSVSFTGGIEVLLDEIDADENPLLEIAADGRSLRVMTKSGMQDGPLALKTKSGEVIATPAVVTAVPSNVSAWTEGDRYKAGKNMTLSCNDTSDAETNYQILKQIEKVLFYKAGDEPIEAPFEASDAYKCLNITVPAEAVDGKIDLVTYAGKQATAVADLTLVKAVVTACDTQVAGGEKFTVTGTDLDLITSVELGDTVCEFTPGEGNTTLEVATERNYQSGRVTLAQANGLEFVAAENLEILAVGKITVTTMPEHATQGDEIALEGANFNMIESVYIGQAKVTSYVFRSDSELRFIVPADAASGSYELTFNLTDGTTETSALQILIAKTKLVEKTLWEGEQVLPSGWSSSLQVPAATFADCTPETLFTLYLTPADGGQLQFKSAAAGWPELHSPHNSPYWNGVDLTAGDTNYAFRLSAEDLSAVQQNGMVIGGQNATLTKLTAMVTEYVSGDKTTEELWSGSFDTAGWAVQAVAASAFASLPADAVYTVTFEPPYDSGAQLTFKNASDWSTLLSAVPSDPEWGCYNIQSGETSYAFTLSADDLAKVQAGGMYLSGQKVVLTKFTATYDGGGTVGEETVVWQGEQSIPTWSDNLPIAASAFSGIKSGATLLLTVRPNTGAAEAWYQYQIASQEEGWPVLDGTAESTDIAAEGTCSVSLTDKAVEQCKTYGIVLKGHEYTLLKVAYK